jgi:hypothetical protein
MTMLERKLDAWLDLLLEFLFDAELVTTKGNLFPQPMITPMGHQYLKTEP